MLRTGLVAILTGIANPGLWMASVAGNDVLAILSGFASNDTPGASTLRDFLRRLTRNMRDMRHRGDAINWGRFIAPTKATSSTQRERLDGPAASWRYGSTARAVASICCLPPWAVVRGHKQVLGVREGHSQSADVCQAAIEDLGRPGLDVRPRSGRRQGRGRGP
jgi:hypothetical protein